MGWLRKVGTWLREAGKRLAFFLLSLLCGIAIPLSTLPAEAWVRGEIDGVNWFAAGVTYVAGIGLVSITKPGLIAMLIAAGGLAFIYGVDITRVFDFAQAHPGQAPPHLDVVWAKVLIGLAALMYASERLGRHIVDNRPFPE